MADLHGLLLRRYLYAHWVATGVDVMPLSKFRLLEIDSMDFAFGRLAASTRTLKNELKEAIK